MRGHRLASIETRKCARCSAEFSTPWSGKVYCTEKCQSRDSVARWTAAHPEEHRVKSLAGTLRWNALHPEELKVARAKTDTKRKWDPKRRADRAARAKLWAFLNPVRANQAHAVREARRRARKRANGGDVSLADWREQLEVFNHACAYCLRTDLPLQMEHVTPIAKGGPHSIENVVPSCAPCNYRKHARGPISTLMSEPFRSF